MLTYWKDLDSAQKCCNTVPVTDKIIYMYIFYVQHLLPGIKCLLPEKKHVFVTRFKCIHGRKQMYFLFIQSVKHLVTIMWKGIRHGDKDWM